MQDHTFSVDVDGSPEEVWGVFWSHRSGKREHGDVTIEILHPGNEVGEGLVRHCTFPVPKWLMSGGRGVSWEWLTEVRPTESWRYDAVGKPLWSKATGWTRLEDLGGNRTRIHFRETYYAFNPVLRRLFEARVHRAISKSNDNTLAASIEKGIRALRVLGSSRAPAVVEGPGRTALGAAEGRAGYRMTTKPPLIFDDPFAAILIGPEWQEHATRSSAGAPERLVAQGRAMVAVRSRYPEDNLERGDYRQYVILGAGLDSFAWRRPDRIGPLTVFEVDLPSIQAWKRKRMTKLGLPANPQHVFVPVNFESDSLADALGQAGFDWTQPTLWSWVGTTMYLSPEAVESTLRTTAKSGAGSEVAFSYNLTSDFLDDDGRAFLESLPGRIGEDTTSLLRSSFSPIDMETMVERCGLKVVDHPTTDDLFDRYYAGRVAADPNAAGLNAADPNAADPNDGLRPFSLERLMSAQVVG